MLAPTQLVKEVYDYRELLVALTYRDIRVKYKQAVMGFLWAFCIPVLSIAAGVVVQAAMAFLQHRSLNMQQVGSVMVRSMPWSMFVGVLSGTANGILGGMGLASRIYFPRQVIPLASVLGTLFDLSISAVVVIVLLLAIPDSPLILSWNLLLVPVFLLLLLMMALGLGLIFGSANVFFRDVKYILNVILQFGIFFTPVYLFIDQLGKLGRVVIWNPVAPLLEGIASVTVGRNGVAGIESGMWPFILYSAAIAISVLYVGMATFRRTENLFAEVM